MSKNTENLIINSVSYKCKHLKCELKMSKITLTSKNFDHHRHLLLYYILVREPGIAAVISGRVVEQDIREVQVSISTHGNPAVLPHRLHGGECCLNWPGERARI